MWVFWANLGKLDPAQPHYGGQCMQAKHSHKTGIKCIVSVAIEGNSRGSRLSKPMLHELDKRDFYVQTTVKGCDALPTLVQTLDAPQ